MPMVEAQMSADLPVSAQNINLDIEIQIVRCPNCGSPAERCYSASQQQVYTQCHQCDYLLATCSETGRVLESYAPGIPFSCLGSMLAGNSTKEIDRK